MTGGGGDSRAVGAIQAGVGAPPGRDRGSETTWLAELAGPSHAVAVAAGQAAADCAREIERSIEEERRRAEAGWQAGAGWSPLTGGRAAALRTRLAELGERRERLVASLAEQATAVNEHTRAAIEHTQEAAGHAEEAAAARRELYGADRRAERPGRRGRGSDAARAGQRRRRDSADTAAPGVAARWWIGGARSARRRVTDAGRARRKFCFLLVAIAASGILLPRGPGQPITRRTARAGRADPASPPSGL